MRGRGVVAAAIVCAAAHSGDRDSRPPTARGRADVVQPRVRHRGSPTRGQVVEGKFDKVRGKDILVLTGRFGFKTLDVSDPTNPKPLDSFLPADLAEGGYWQNEDMELDTRAS